MARSIMGEGASSRYIVLMYRFDATTECTTRERMSTQAGVTSVTPWRSPVRSWTSPGWKSISTWNVGVVGDGLDQVERLELRVGEPGHLRVALGVADVPADVEDAWRAVDVVEDRAAGRPDPRRVTPRRCGPTTSARRGRRAGRGGGGGSRCRRRSCSRACSRRRTRAACRQSSPMMSAPSVWKSWRSRVR